jgi:hypothetical protein
MWTIRVLEKIQSKMKEMLLRLSFNVLMAQRRKVGFRKYG